MLRVARVKSLTTYTIGLPALDRQTDRRAEIPQPIDIALRCRPTDAREKYTQWRIYKYGVPDP